MMYTYFKKSILPVIVLLWLPLFSLAQVKPVYQINYERIENGTKSEAGVSFLYHDELVYLYKATDKIQQYIDYRREEIVNMLQFGNAAFKNVIPFKELPKPAFGTETLEILGYTCKYASFTYFSNSIEVWYILSAPAKGSPYANFLPEKGALALKIIINGNRELIATSIEIAEDITLPNYAPDKARTLNEAEFEEMKINSRFTRFPVFTQDTINFDPDMEITKDEILQSGKIYHFSRGSVILKKIRLSRNMCNSGFVFANLSCRSNGDAYDRTGSVFMIPESEGITLTDALHKGLSYLPVFTDNDGNNYQGIRLQEDYQPPVELMRFFTSFGAGYFNKIREINNYPWEEKAVYKQEITSLIPWEPQDVWIGVFIGNYDKGGHIVDLDLNFYPGSLDESEMVPKYIQPLFSTINVMEMLGQNYGRLFGNDTLKVSFHLPEGISGLKLLYTSTGHGGWGGGDEFNPKLNKILIDGKPVYEVIPWRTDCATYRFYNPASGNFSNGLSSSDLSRSNWCPGTLTPPYVVPLNQLQAGPHTLEVVIEQGNDEGESFNHWGVSGVLTGYRQKQ